MLNSVRECAASGKDGVIWEERRPTAALSLTVQAIRIESISDHSKRWGLLLGTVTGLQWLLSGFLERKLLDLVSHAVVAENRRQRLVAWSEIPLFKDLGKKMGAWQQAAAKREELEGRAVCAMQTAWRAHRQRRELLARERPYHVHTGHFSAPPRGRATSG